MRNGDGPTGDMRPEPRRVLTGTGGWASLSSASLERYAGYYAFSELVTVDAIRVKASNAQLCLDELELYGTTIP